MRRCKRRSSAGAAPSRAVTAATGTGAGTAAGTGDQDGTARPKARAVCCVCFQTMEFSPPRSWSSQFTVHIHGKFRLFSPEGCSPQVALPPTLPCAPAEQIFPSGLSRERSVGWSRAKDGTIDKQRPSSSNGRRSWDHDRLAPRVDCDSRSGPSCAEAAPTGGAVAEAADSRE
jgi:hypothetical protein